MNNSYCPLAFSGLFVSPKGQVGLCCDATDKYFDKYITKPEDIVIHWKSPELEEIRRKMSHNEKIEQCSKCYQIEEAGGKSPRLFAYERFGVVAPKKFPTYLDFRPSNKCNAQCIICSSPNSSKLANEVDEHPDLLEYFGKAHTTDWFTDDVRDLLFKRQNDIQVLKFLGGEPTLNKSVYDFLQYANNTDIVISITTNASKPAKRFFDKLSRFKNATINLSVDSFEDDINFLRYPLTASEIKDSLAHISQYNFPTSFNCVVTVFNVLNIPKYVKYVEDNFPNANINFTPVSCKDYLSANLLKPELKEHCKTRIDDVIKTAKVDIIGLEAVIDELLKLPDNEVIIKHNDFVNKLEHYRNVYTQQRINVVNT